MARKWVLALRKCDRLHVAKCFIAFLYFNLWLSYRCVIGGSSVWVCQVFHSSLQSLQKNWCQYVKTSQNKLHCNQTPNLNNTGSSKKMDGIWNHYNLKSTGRICTFGVLKCLEKFKVLDLCKLIILNSVYKWVAVTVTTAWRVLRLQMEERPPIRRVAANILNKQSRTADEGWSSSWGGGRGANNASPWKNR